MPTQKQRISSFEESSNLLIPNLLDALLQLFDLILQLLDLRQFVANPKACGDLSLSFPSQKAIARLARLHYATTHLVARVTQITDQWDVIMSMRNCFSPDQI